MSLNAVLAHIDADLDNSVSRLFDLVRIPSISTDAKYKAECRKAGQWIVTELKALGFDASLRDTPGHPMVVAHHMKAGAKATHALFYGHYDVQPADPLEKWTSPPFEPVRRKDKDGVERLYARGTADDKGQLMTFLEAMRAWIKKTGGLPINCTVLIEGEEESGSPSLDPFLKANKKELSCDAAFVCDTDMWNAKTPAITTRLRGLTHEEMVITGPRIDLHSGLFGGPSMNPLRVMSKILGNMHDKNGKITIPGFYDGVTDLPKATKAQWKALKFNEKAFLKSVGLSVPAGEKGRMVLEQLWSRPTAEVNGMWGGYIGEGSKTVLPSQATAKLSFRLVGKQDPEKVRKAFQKWVKAQLPKDCKVEFLGGSGNAGMVMPEDNRFVQSAAAALKAEYKKQAVLKGSGGSIPIVKSFRDILGMDSVLVGFGLDDDAIHSPNEKYDLASYHRGQRSWARILAELAS